LKADLRDAECVSLVRVKVVPQTLGKKWTRPARMAGSEAHSMAAVVSSVDQKVVGMLSHVGSAVRPKVLRLCRRIIEVMHTL